MRVAHLMPTLELGGRERTVIDLARTGPARGIESLVITHDAAPDDRRLIDAAGIEHVRLDPRHGELAGQIGTTLARHKIDLLHVHGHISAIHARNVPTAKIATLHMAIGSGWRWALQIRRGLRAMDRLAAVSDDLARRFEPLAGRPIEVLSTGVDLGRFSPLPDPHNDLLTVGMVSRLHPVKRHRDAIRAIAMLRRQGIPVRLIIAGDGSLAPSLRRRSDALTPSIDLIGPVDDVPALLARLDIFLLCSSHEGMPIALLEAMASGLACVATGVGGVPALAGDGSGLLLVRPRSPAAIRDALIALIDPARRANAGRCNRKVAEDHGLEHQADRYAALYDEVLRSR